MSRQWLLAALMAVCTYSQAGVITTVVEGTLSGNYAWGHISAHTSPWQNEFKSVLVAGNTFSFTFEYDESLSHGDGWVGANLVSGHVGTYDDLSAFDTRVSMNASGELYFITEYRQDYVNNRFQAIILHFVEDSVYGDRTDFRAEGRTLYGLGGFGGRSDFATFTHTAGQLPGDTGNNPPGGSIAVNEPASLALMLLGLGALLGLRRCGDQGRGTVCA